MMPPALVNSACFGTSGSGFFPLTLPFTPSQGNKLLLSISQYESSNITLVNTSGVVWSPIQTRQQAPGSLGVFAEHWIGDVVDASPGTNLDIFRSGGFTDAAIAVHEVSGLRRIWPPDRLADAIGSASPALSGQANLPFNPESYFFGSIAGADSSATTVPGAPSNGFTKREECVGPNANQTIGHRITTFDKVVSASENATSQLAYSGFTRWAGLMTTLRGANETAKPIQLLQKASIAVASNPDTITLPSAPTSGSTIILLVAIDLNQSISGISQVGVSSWTQDAAITHTNLNIRVEIWRSSPTLNAAQDIVVTASGSSNAIVFAEEYSGILEGVLTQTPFDQAATNEGAGGAVTTGTTAAIDSKDELIIGIMAQLNTGAVFQEMPGFFREQQDVSSTMAAAVALNDESFATLTYQIAADSAGSGDWAAAIVTYRSVSPTAQEGPSIGIASAELNQGGTTSPVTLGTFSSFVSIPAGTFTDGNRHLILAVARIQNTNGTTAIELKIGGSSFDSASFRPYAPALSTRSETWAVCRLATLSDTDAVSIDLRHVSGNTGEVRQINLVVIDLDSINIFSGRDWFHAEDSTVLANMDTVFANNVGAILRFRPDGVGSYVVIGHARMSCTNSTPVANENVMRLRDVSGSQTLAQAGWHKELSTDINTRAYNVMAILDTPSKADIDLAIEMIGGGGGNGWQHEDSSITVLRLDAFFSSGFDQDRSLNQSSPGSVMPPTAGSVSAQAQFPYEPDSLGEIITLAYTEANHVANDTLGIASQAQFPGVARSLWDTENTTLGNTVVNTSEINAGNYDTNDADTRIPTFGVSRRTGIAPIPDTAQWFNGGSSGNASVINRVAMACFGRAAAPVPIQSDPPTPVPIPTPTTVLTEKPSPQHEDEALDNQLEQFKPGVV